VHAVSNQDQPPYSQVDILFSNTINYKSLTGPNLYEPKYRLIEALAWEILALYTHLTKYLESARSFQPRRPTTIFQSRYHLFKYNELKIFKWTQPLCTQIHLVLALAWAILAL
jgi:hypothetical protein